MPVLTLLVRVYIGGFFLYAAVPKIVEPLAFATSISHYGLMPLWAVNAMALVLPWLELLAGVGLLLGYRTKTSAFVSGILLIAFTAAVAWAVMNGLHIDCGCFGESGGEEVSWLKVGKNTLMLLGCVLLFLHPRSLLSMDERIGANDRP